MFCLKGNGILRISHFFFTQPPFIPFQNPIIQKTEGRCKRVTIKQKVSMQPAVILQAFSFIIFNSAVRTQFNCL